MQKKVSDLLSEDANTFDFSDTPIEQKNYTIPSTNIELDLQLENMIKKIEGV